jgi:hypothetical protein
MNRNCTTYEYTKRNWVRRCRCDRFAVYDALLFGFGDVSGSSTYLSERSCKC